MSTNANGSDMEAAVDDAEELLRAITPSVPTTDAAAEGAVELAATAPSQSKPRKTPKRTSARKTRGHKVARKTRGRADAVATQRRTVRAFPASTFEEALELPLAIQQIGGGEKVRRLTLFEQLDKSPESSASRQMITNANRYGLTTGSYQAEWLELTQLGRQATNTEIPPRERLRARFELAIDQVEPFHLLYERLRDRRLPTHAVMRDVLAEAGYAADQLQECVETFIVNAKFLGLLRTIGGSERLISIDQLLDEQPQAATINATMVRADASEGAEMAAAINDWSRVCFYVSPIGDTNSETRQHSDLILASLVEPAVVEMGLTVVRADGIDKPGVITKQIIEHIAKARLVIADLSFHNPNVFYELALRHATGKPTIHLIRSSDRIPFDIDQFRTIRIDTTGLYAFVPQIETYRAEIATHARRALDDEGTPAGPLSVFYPEFATQLMDAA